MKARRKVHVWINLAIVLCIALAYWVTNEPLVHQTLGQVSDNPYYHASGNRVCFLTRYDDDGASLLQFCQTATEQNIKLTIAVTAAWAQENKDIVQRIQSSGHAWALYGQTTTESASDTAWTSSMSKQKQQFEQIIGTKIHIYMPLDGEYTQRDVQFCKDNSLLLSLYSFDSRAIVAQDAQSFAQQLGQRIKAGDFIYLPVNEISRQSLSQLSIACTEKQVVSCTVEEALIETAS